MMPSMAPTAHGTTPKPHATAEASPTDRPEASAVRDTVMKLGPGLIAANRCMMATVSSGCTSDWTDGMDNDLLLMPARGFPVAAEMLDYGIHCSSPVRALT